MIIEKKEFKRLLSYATENFLQALRGYTFDLSMLGIPDPDIERLLTRMISGSSSSFACGIEYTYGRNISHAINLRIADGYGTLLECQRNGYDGNAIERVVEVIKKGLE